MCANICDGEDVTSPLCYFRGADCAQHTRVPIVATHFIAVSLL